MSRYGLLLAITFMLALGVPTAAAQTWTVYEGVLVDQNNPGFTDVIPAEEAMGGVHGVSWGPPGSVRFFPSWNWDTPQPGDKLCWLYDRPDQQVFWMGVFQQPSTSLRIQLNGCDSNDGVVEVYIDGVMSYSYNTYNKNKVVLVVTGLPNVAHSVELRTLLSGSANAGDVSIDYVAVPGNFWNHKMHFPQLPDEDGWDVYDVWPTMWLADDWKCSKTGTVDDLHFWGSWRDDIEGQVVKFHVQIRADVPADPNNPASFSHPGTLLWSYDVYDFGIVPVDPQTMEGWYEPATGLILPNNHQHYFRYDINFAQIIPNPSGRFTQTVNTIYWMLISAELQPTLPGVWGWKSSEDHWNDDAVWSTTPGIPTSWHEITEPMLAPTFKSDEFYVEVNELHEVVAGGGTGFENGSWYYYPETFWWNQFFWDDPFDWNRQKIVHIEFDVEPLIYGPPAYLTLAVNWSTYDWWLLQYGPTLPPIPSAPGFNELTQIGRNTLISTPLGPGCRGDCNCDGQVDFADINPFVTAILLHAYCDVTGYNADVNGNGVVDFGDINPFVSLLTLYPLPIICPPSGPQHLVFDWVWPNYNPEWVSIDVQGYNFRIYGGIIRHACVPREPSSLDLSFVITSQTP